MKNHVCIYCGKSLAGLFRANHRKFCSHMCCVKAAYYKKYPNRPHKLWQHEQSTFERAMELYWGGEESATIARRLEIPVGTVYSWVHDFGGLNRRTEPLKNRLKFADSADEWVFALRENTRGEDYYEEEIIHIACEKLNGQSVNKLATVVLERLNDNPLCGKTYAFCSKNGREITTLSWAYPIYHISKYVKVNGTFIWPHENLGTVIEITKTEFEHLISLQKYNKIIVENT